MLTPTVIYKGHSISNQTISKYQIECCVGVSTETVLQVVKFYTIVNWEKI